MSAPTPPPGFRPAHPLPPAAGASRSADLSADGSMAPAPSTPVAPAASQQQRPGRPRPVPQRSAPARQAARPAAHAPVGERTSEPATTPPDSQPVTAKRSGNRLRGHAATALSAARGGRGPEPRYDGSVDEDFDVPPIGGRPSYAKSQQWAVRLGIPVGVLLVAAGSAFAFGVNTGSSRVPAAGAISQDEALRFRLSSFPVEQAAVFGQRYLDTCLTRPAASDTTAARARAEVLARMATSGTSAGCGYSGTSTAEAEQPQSIVFTGQIRSVKEGYDDGAAAYLTFQVSYDADKTLDAVVPVWVNDRDDPTLMRVVGDVGFMPSPRLGAPPAYNETRAKDSQLATQLRDQVLTPFLQAWGSSDGQQLNLTLTEDAAFAARAGLRGLMVNPTITKVTVFTGRSESGGTITYQSGDEVVAETAVQWTSALSTSKQSGAYRIRLRYVQGKWAVVDVTGSAVDPTGGPVPNGSGAVSGASDSSGQRGSSATSGASAPTSAPADPAAFDPAGVPG